MSPDFAILALDYNTLFFLIEWLYRHESFVNLTFQIFQSLKYYTIKGTWMHTKSQVLYEVLTDMQTITWVEFKLYNPYLEVVWETGHGSAYQGAKLQCFNWCGLRKIFRCRVSCPGALIWAAQRQTSGRLRNSHLWAKVPRYATSQKTNFILGQIR